MAGLNWFTIAAILSAIGLTVIGTVMVITTDMTLDHIAALIIIGTVGITSAVLSLHLAKR